jgi:hypothetical protein
MALDSLGLGLTLDTTILEKADKTLENMHRNSQLIMQNLNRGFSAFNSGDAKALTSAFDAIKKSMDTIKNSKVSVEFDTAGQDRFLESLNQIMGQVERIRQIGKVGDNKIKFFDPSTVKVTTESLTELQAKAQEIEEAFKEVQKELSHAIEFGKDVSGNDAKIAKLKDDLSEIGKAAGLVTKDFSQMKNELMDALSTRYSDYSEVDKALKEREKQINAEAKAENSKISKQELENLRAQDEQIQQLKASVEEKKKVWEEASDILKKYTQQLEELRTLEAKKEAHDNLQLNRDKEKAYQELLAENRAQQKFASATTAQQDAMIVSEEHKRLSEESKRIATLTKNYLEAVSNYEKYQSELSQLLDNIATVGKKQTSAQDAERTRLLQEIDKARSIINQLKKEAPEVIEKIEAAKKGEGVQKKAAEDAEKVKASLDYAKVFSDNAKSIDEEIEAISMLKRARNALSSDNNANYNKEVAEVNKRISKHEDHIKLLTQEQKESKTLEDSVISRYLRERKEADKLGDELRELNRTRKERGTDYSPEEKKNIDALISRWRTLRKDISEIEENNEAHLSQLQEKYASQRAEDEIKRMLATNEREKQEYAKLLDEKYALEKQKKAIEDAGAKVGDKAYDNILQQEKDLNARISQLRAKHKKDLDEIDKKNNKKRNDDDVKAFIEAQKEKQRIAEEYAKKQREKAKKYGTISSASADRLIGVTENAKNINQHKEAIKKLTQAKSSLDNTDKNYFVTLKKIDKALRRHHKALREAGVESNNLMQSHRGLLNIGGQLARRLALAFSVSQLTQYFRKLVEVRGQFEKTEVALTSIIGDNQKAQKLMNQTIALAIKSPFTLQQLTGYTKQLAAYQVSYEELHSTTKMLADVSAGLGVEMDRLILAFGQVKAANYLRATEVRQFTEAGFNILGELKDYYNDLNDTMLSVGDVQEMVTKRMVDFEDVAEIFKRVTQEGGRFYEMQSKQAETLAGQWTNLQDRIDVMLNEIGTDREGLLKGLVRMLASLIDNWEAIADVIKIVVGAFVLYKMNLLAVTKSQIANNLATQESIKLKIKEALAAKSLAPIYKNLSSSMRGFGSAMKVFGKANLWVAALTAVIGSITAIVKQVQKMKEVLAEQDKIFNENTVSLLKLSEQYKKASKGADAYNSKIKVLQELSDKLEDRNLTLSVKIEEVDKNNIDKVFEENAKRLQKAYDLGKDLGKAIAQGMNEAQGNFLGFSFLGENLKEDAEDYGQSMGKLMSWGMQAQMESIEEAARVNYAKMGKYAKEYYNSIKDGKRKNETEYEWTKRRATALALISKLEGDIVGKNKELRRTLSSVVSDGLELHHETKGIYKNLVKAAGSIANLRRKVSNNPIEMAAQIKTEIDKLDYDPATKQFIINDLYAMLHLKVNYVEDPNAQSPYQWDGFRKDLKKSRDDLKKFVDENNKSLGYENFFFSEDEIKKLGEFSDALEAIQKKYDENKKTIEQLDGTSDEYSKGEKARLEALQAELKEVAKKWNYDLDAKDKKGDNEALKKLKDQIKLIKDANKAYEERNKKFGKEDSKAVVTDSYKDAFKEVELAIEDIDYTNLEGVVAALESLEAEAKKAGGQVDLLKAISEVKAEIGLTLKERQDEVLFSQVQEIFDDYEFAIDIKKLNLPPEVAKNLFGVDTKSFDQMRTEIISKFAGTNEEVSKILSKGYEVSAEDEKILIEAIGEDRVDKAKEALEKIQDLEDKDQLERLKMYSEYAKKGITKRANIKLEELRKLQEIEETFTEKPQEVHDIEKAKKEGATEEEIARLEEENKKIREGNKLIEERNALRKPTKEAAIAGVQKESKEQLQKLDWEEFEKSDMFIRVFDDLDAASSSLLEHMISKIQDFKDEWTDMPLEDVEKIVDALNKLQLKLAESNPWGEFKKAKKDLEDAKKAVKFEDTEAKTLAEKGGEGNYMAALDKEDVAQQEKRDNAIEQIALLETQLAITEKIVATTDEERDIKAGLISQIESELTTQKGIKKSSEDNLKATGKVRAEHKRVKTALAAQYSATSECLNMAVELGGAISDLVGTLTDDDPAMVFAEMSLNMLTTVANTLALQAQLIAAQTEATGLGAAMNTAAGVIGWIVMAIQLLVTAISAAVNYADKMRQMSMDVLAGQVEHLKNKFDELAESIDEAWSYKQLEEYSKELDKVQKKMISTQKQYIQLLRSGKDSEKTIATAEAAQAKLDNGVSVDSLSKKEKKALLSEEYEAYKQATEDLAEMEENYADQKKELLEELGGVADPKEAAEEFVDAWLEAYKETGDGLSGLDEKFDEFFENLIKKKAAMLVAEKALTGWVDAINNALDMESSGGADITSEEQEAINKAAEDAKEKANKILLGIFEGMDFGEAEGEGLSGLQKGIQGITEDQADILAAYWNSVRGYTASIDAKFDALLANMGISLENPQLIEMRNQSVILGEINLKMEAMNATIAGLVDASGKLKVNASTQLDSLIKTRANGGLGLNIVND